MKNVLQFLIALMGQLVLKLPVIVAHVTNGAAQNL